jgi:hypothetical protein
VWAREAYYHLDPAVPTLSRHVRHTADVELYWPGQLQHQQLETLGG